MTVDQNAWPEAKDYFMIFARGADDHKGRRFLYNGEEVRTSDDGEKLYIGRAGTSGIEFIMQQGTPDVWAYYPVDGSIEWKADDIYSFVKGWMAGDIKV